MFKFNFKTTQKKILDDSITTIELYLKLRDVYPNTLLLEFYNSKSLKENFSIFCINPISELVLYKKILKIYYPNNVYKHISIKKKLDTIKFIEDFLVKFKDENNSICYSGLYGYISYDSIPYFENIKFNVKIENVYNIPKIRLGFYKNIIIFYHFCNKLNIIEHQFYNTEKITYVNQLIKIIKKKNFSLYQFKTVGDYSSNVSDIEYKEMVAKGIKYCLRGDVFQIVLSRQFKQEFEGDEFNVYRALRIINPSPYLFYFDYGNYKLFGSSPESQIIIHNNVAYISPIAGTIKNTINKRNNCNEYKKLSINLLNDPKENSEHIMLIDLARNDLSKNSYNIKIEQFKEIQVFSHVLHIVSKVSGKLEDKISILKVFSDTFPAGTLSGAPKYKAMELIDKIENQNRGVYGGAIGFFGLNNSNINMAIIIRSFLSKNNTLFFQAGAGIVYSSKEKNELEEVNNKLLALFKAIKLAKNI
ncbi:anthranilate synthase component I family protein [Blattabacterium cuenoti]|uniref:anthranilate synthase component I family protein n=1 Tax=Blattabacterium cuenoti TaxID=1653831 RepID=UPI00163C624B|nr:chorismate-binding protein [Blattabacterium cuenoti]